jgi:hypothetical protein
VLEPLAEAGRSAPVAGKGATDEDFAVSLAWTGLQPTTTADAILGLNLATNFSEFRAAAAKFAVPAQNLVYADTSGHIGAGGILASARLGLLVLLARLRQACRPAVGAGSGGRDDRHGQSGCDPGE